MNGFALQLLISIAGVSVMIGACALIFGTRDVLISSVDALARQLAWDVPGFRAGRAALSRDGRTALIENARDGAVYLAVVRGDEIVTRRLSHGAFAHVAREGGTLSLALGEFTLDRASLDLGDGEAADAWETRLKAIAA